MKKCEVGNMVSVILEDGTMLEGNVVKTGQDHLVIDDILVWHDWVWIDCANVKEMIFWV